MTSPWPLGAANLVKGHCTIITVHMCCTACAGHFTLIIHYDLEGSKRPSEQGLRESRREQPTPPARGGQDGREWVLSSSSSLSPSFPEPDFPPQSLTVLSKPSVINIRKKMMAKNVDAGMLAMASAYVMKRRLGPETEREREGHGRQDLPFKAVLGETWPHRQLQFLSQDLTYESGLDTY